MFLWRKAEMEVGLFVFPRRKMGDEVEVEVFVYRRRKREVELEVEAFVYRRQKREVEVFEYRRWKREVEVEVEVEVFEFRRRRTEAGQLCQGRWSPSIYHLPAQQHLTKSIFDNQIHLQFAADLGKSIEVGVNSEFLFSMDRGGNRRPPKRGLRPSLR